MEASPLKGADERANKNLSLALSLDLVSRKWSVGSVRGEGEREASRLTLVGRGLHEEEVVVNKRVCVCEGRKKKRLTELV